jgi:hypothetical protein
MIKLLHLNLYQLDRMQLMELEKLSLQQLKVVQMEPMEFHFLYLKLLESKNVQQLTSFEELMGHLRLVLMEFLKQMKSLVQKIVEVMLS